MTVSVNSYGTAAKVAALTPRYATSGAAFDTTTRPTLVAVEGMIDRVSALVNAYLKALGFDIPLTDSDNVLAMENIVLDTVAVMVEGVNGSGRYGPASKTVAQRGMWAVLNDDVRAYLDAIADGLTDETRTDAGKRPSSVAVSKVDYGIA